jgi:hypothetical protein
MDQKKKQAIKEKLMQAAAADPMASKMDKNKMNTMLDKVLGALYSMNMTDEEMKAAGKMMQMTGDMMMKGL